jgi:tripartite-type tricarboxylate transporter receptor subunit TctC
VRPMSAFLACAVLLFAAPAWSMTWPLRPVTVVVPYTPGGTNDIIARLVAPRVGASLGQSVVVQNKPGAGGNLGAQQVAHAPADGYTVLAGSSAVLAINRWVYDHPGYNPEADFAPIALAGTVPNVLLVNPSLPMDDVRELVRFARRHPMRLTYGSMGAGTTGHLSGEMLQLLAGIEMQHVPYKGSAPALIDLVGGHIDMMFDNLPTALPLVRSGLLKALAVTTAQRSPLLPEVPTLAELGVRGFEVYAWFGFVAPAATPAPVLDRLNAEIVKALTDDKVRPELARQGVNVVAGSRADFAAFIAQESQMWRRLAQRTRARAD